MTDSPLRLQWPATFLWEPPIDDLQSMTATPASKQLLEGLNAQQRDAVTHGDGPLLIVAGAGTGKTTTLAHRVAYQIVAGVHPARILLLTFTRRAAEEMLRRVEGILRSIRRDEGSRGQTPSLEARVTRQKTWGGTFHSVAMRLLRIHGESIGIDPDFTVHDRADSEDLLNVVRAELGLARTDRRFPRKGTCMAIYSRCVNASEPIESVLSNVFPWCVDDADDLKRLFRAYVDRKEQQVVLDYDDLLLFWRGLLSSPAVAAAVRERFDRVLVDEFQDTNTVQADIIRGLCPEGQGLTVVGDDAQSIYSFRAATVRNILDFPKQFPGTTIVTLEENYRSTQPILEATNRVIAGSKERFTKNLWSRRERGPRPGLLHCRDEEEQTEFLVQQILDLRESGIDLRRQAVLYRTSHHSLALELELSRRNIPFHKYGGLKFVETAHVKDLVAFLRLAENPRDSVAGMRLLLLFDGIGPKRASKLLSHLALSHGEFRCWKDCEVPPTVSERWPHFVALLEGLAAGKPSSLSAQIHDVRKFYEPLLERKYDHTPARLRDLEQLEHVAGQFRDRREFLSQWTLDPPASTQDLAGPPLLDDDYLVLSTIHSAKGLEWDAVYVIHAADGNIPSDMATGKAAEIEEERRLFYVALTRAKDWLFVCFPLRYYANRFGTADRHGYAQLTRFLDEEARRHFEERAAAVPSPTPETDLPQETPPSASKVRDEVRAMWS